MTIQVLLTADNHLDPPASSFGAKRFERRRDHLRCFEEVIEYAKKNRPDLMLLAGDVFDTIRPGNLIRSQLMEHLRSVHNLGVRIFAVSGDHDTPRSSDEGASPLSVYGNSGYVRFFDNTSEFKSSKFTVEGTRIDIVGLSRNPLMDAARDPLGEVKPHFDGDIRILLTHYPVEGFVGYSRNDPLIRLSSIPMDCQLVGVGHFHSYQTKQLRNTSIIYPGSTERASFQEEKEQKGFVWLELDRDGIVSKEHIRTTARQYKTIEAPFPVEAPIESLKKLLDEHVNPDVVVRLRLKGHVKPEALAGYRRAELLMHGENKFFHIAVDESELTVESPEPIAALPRSTPLEELRRYFQHAIEASGKDREILEEALRLCEAKLQEAGAW